METMKTRILLVIGILLLTSSFSISKAQKSRSSAVQSSSFNVFTSPELFPLTTRWVSEYCKLNPVIKVDVIQSEDKEIARLLQTGKGIGFVSDQSLSNVTNQPGWNMVVGRDVIVPVMNVANPCRDEILKKGITTAGLARIIETSEKLNWGMLLGNTQNIAGVPMHFLYMNDQSVISGLTNFVNANQLKLNGIKTESALEMISAIQKDPNAMGFCKLIQILNPDNQTIADNIQLIPIDKNGNGKIDYMEAIYDNQQEFSRGVWIGKYPDALSGTIYSVSSSKPKNEAELAFLNWVLTDGQKILITSGYTDLVLNERKTQLEKINQPEMYAAAPSTSYSLLMIILMVVFVLVVAGVIMDNLVVQKRIRKSTKGTTVPVFNQILEEKSVNIPKGLYFDKTHTWAFMKKDGKVKIGIDDFLQHVTGPLTRIELKKTGEKIKKGEHLLTIIQKGKQLNVYSPVTGTITEYNKNLLNNATLLNDSPFTDGWIYMVEPTNWLVELQFLNMTEKYKNWLTDEFLRLKDFFATAVRIHVPAFAMVLQDGGVLRDGILADLGPEIWDDFQTKFMDANR
jgi:glycine cleavage system H lipoate-binding protein/ABC-type phosphate transport system substrate-binding protein